MNFQLNYLLFFLHFKKDFIIDENLVKFKINDKLVEKVIDFYNESPFPNYEDEDKSSISFKGDNNYLAENFKNFVGFNKDILEEIKKILQ